MSQWWHQCIKRQHTSLPRIALFMVSCIATMCAITYILNFVAPQHLFHCFSRLTHASIIIFLLVHPPLCNTLPRHSNIRTCQSFSANHSGFIVYLILHFIVKFSWFLCRWNGVTPPFSIFSLPSPAGTFLSFDRAPLVQQSRPSPSAVIPQ